MNINKEILSNPLFIEVMDLAKQKGIEVTISYLTVEGTSGELGTTNFDAAKKVIDINIYSAGIDRIEVYIHELLHAKSHLLGYPHIENYKFIEMNPYVHDVIGSIDNSFHHYVMVYPEMKRLGYNQNEIDKQFIDSITNNCEIIFEGLMKLVHTVDLLELFLRSPESFQKVEEKIQIHQEEEYQLFNKIKSYMLSINSPLEMRAAYAKVLKTINEFVYKHTNISTYLNILVLASPIFPDSYYEEIAANSLYTLKIEGYPHVFVLDIDNNQCCFFLSNNGSDLNKNAVDEILRQCKLSDFIKLLS